MYSHLIFLLLFRADCICDRERTLVFCSFCCFSVGDARVKTVCQVLIKGLTEIGLYLESLCNAKICFQVFIHLKCGMKDRRYFIIDQQIEWLYVLYSECFYHPPPLLAIQIIKHFLTSRISASQR